MINQLFVIHGETPAKKNSRIFNTKTKRLFTSKQYSQWHNDALVQLRPQIKFANIDVPCEITLQFIHGDYRRRDSDNGTASIMDLLVDAGIIADDNWKIIRRIIIENSYNKDNPCCFINIKTME